MTKIILYCLFSNYFATNLKKASATNGSRGKSRIMKKNDWLFYYIPNYDVGTARQIADNITIFHTNR